MTNIRPDYWSPVGHGKRKTNKINDLGARLPLCYRTFANWVRCIPLPPALREPADDAVALAIEANNAFVAWLEQIAAEWRGGNEADDL